MPEVIRYLKHERRHNSSLIVDPAVLAMYLQTYAMASCVTCRRGSRTIWSEVELLASRLWQMDKVPPLLPPCIGAWVTAGPGGGMGGLSTSGCSRSSITPENVILRISAPVQFPSATSRSRWTISAGRHTSRTLSGQGVQDFHYEHLRDRKTGIRLAKIRPDAGGKTDAISSVES